MIEQDLPAQQSSRPADGRPLLSAPLLLEDLWHLRIVQHALLTIYITFYCFSMLEPPSSAADIANLKAAPSRGWEGSSTFVDDGRRGRRRRNGRKDEPLRIGWFGSCYAGERSAAIESPTEARESSREHQLALQCTPHHIQHKLLHLSHILQHMLLRLSHLALNDRAAEQPRAGRCSSQPCHLGRRVRKRDMNSFPISLECNEHRARESKRSNAQLER